MQPLYIFDLDGTLANCEHRQHLVQPGPCFYCHGCGEIPGESPCKECNGTKKLTPNWREFFARYVDDTPIPAVVNTMARLAHGGAELWIFSGRSGEVAEQTVHWLNENVPNVYSRLTMRSEGDFTPDDILKKQWLDEMSGEDRTRLVAVFDDRDKVVAMWRAAGVPCFQVAPGSF